MSWHSGDWANFSVTVSSAIASAAAAYAAIISLKTTKAALKSQQESSLLEREIHTRELLKADASRANSSLNGVSGNDWSFNQVANIVGAIDSARKTIINARTFINEEALKSYFKDQLAYEITRELDQESPPDSIFRPNGEIHLSFHIFYLWSSNKDFFDYPPTTITGTYD